MTQVTARLCLEAALMATDEEKFKEVYAAKIVKTDNRKVGPKPSDLCNQHQNPKHTNAQCFSQKNKSSSNQPSPFSDNEMIKRYKALVSLSEKSDAADTPKKTAANAVTSKTDDDEFITYLAFSASTHKPPSDTFLIDTGANTHIASDHSLLHNIVPIPPVVINGIAGTTGHVTAKFKGTASIACHNTAGQERIMKINNVLLVPDAGVNLLSVSKVTNDGARFSGDSNHITLSNVSKDYVITGTGTDGLYKVRAIKAPSLFAAPASVPADVWHRRFGHLNNISLTKVSPSSSQKVWCEACALAKAHRLPFSSQLPMSESPLFQIHSDVAGPMPVVSTGSGRYVVSFIDDATRYNYVCVIKSKSQVFSQFVKFLNEAERLHGKQIKILKSDRGGEYMSNEFKKYLSDKGISFERAPPETPEQNPVSERFNRSLLERARAIMIDAGIPHHLWGEVVMTVSLLLNLSPSSTLDMNTPHNLWHEDLPGTHSSNTDFLRAIGCAAYPLLKTTEINKLSLKSKRCVLVGYEVGARAYRLWDIASRKIIVSRNIIFNEKLFPFMLNHNKEESMFEIDDVLTNFPPCEHNKTHTHPVLHMDENTTKNKNRNTIEDSPLPNNLNPFFHFTPNSETFQRPRSLLTSQFPEYLPSPLIKSSDPPRNSLCISPLSLSSSSSHTHSPSPSPPSSPLRTNNEIKQKSQNARTPITRH